MLFRSVSDDPRKQPFPSLNLTDQVLAEFIFDRASGQFGLAVGTLAERTQRAG